MRVLEIGTRKHTKVVVTDEPSHGGACHEYQVVPVDNPPGMKLDETFSVISFQKGPIKEHGVNGIHNEDLIAIVIDRVRCFQCGDYACRENACALTKLEEALMWLRSRTNEREARGVEGTHEK